MIQRIQSIYLFVAAIALAVMFLFPISSYYGDLNTLQLDLLGIKSLVPGESTSFQTYFTYPLIALVAIIILLSIITILKFKNRKFQLQLIKVNVLINILLIVAIFIVYSNLVLKQVEVDEEYGISAFLPLISLVMYIMAFRGVKKDEDLIKSADRLR